MIEFTKDELDLIMQLLKNVSVSASDPHSLRVVQTVLSVQEKVTKVTKENM